MSFPAIRTRATYKGPFAGLRFWWDTRIIRIRGLKDVIVRQQADIRDLRCELYKMEERVEYLRSQRAGFEEEIDYLRGQLNAGVAK